MRCPECEAEGMRVTRVVRPVAAALPEVMADGLEEWTCDACGEVSSVWPRGGPLIDLVIRVVLAKAGRLAPAEFRWLRERLGWKGVELARSFGVTPEIVSKWERGKARISSQSDRLLRALVALRRGLGADAVRLELADDDAPVRGTLVLGPEGWVVASDSAGGGTSEAGGVHG